MQLYYNTFMKKYITQNGASFDFAQSIDDFKVYEVASVVKSKNGNFLVLKIHKEGVSTFDAIKTLAKFLNIPTNDITFLGLKDKHATSEQFLCLDNRHEKSLKFFKEKYIQIVDFFRYNKALKRGGLDGNNFEIVLHNVKQIDAGKIEKRFKKIEKNGLLNFFGEQRFGKNEDNFDQASKVIHGEEKVKDKNIEDILKSAYKSKFFNDWLKDRVEFNKDIISMSPNEIKDKYSLSIESINKIKKQTQEFKLLDGDILYSTITQKEFNVKNVNTLLKDFNNKKIFPTGLMVGKGVYRSQSDAYVFESKIDDIEIFDKGFRRGALAYIKNTTFSYINNENKVILKFFLPKSAYATELIAQL